MTERPKVTRFIDSVHASASRLPFIGQQIELVFAMLIAFLFRVLGAGMTFAMTVVIVRGVGATQAGYFYLGLSSVAMLATVGNLGLEFALLRFAGAAASQSRWQRVRALSKIAARRSGLALAALAIVMAGLADPIARYIFRQPGTPLASVFLIISPAIPFLGLSLIGAYLLQAIRHTKQAAMIFSIITPTLMVTACLLIHPKSAQGLSGTYAAATFATVVSALFFYWRATRQDPGQISLQPAEIVRTGRTLWGGIIANQLLMNNGQLIAGMFLIPHDITVFAVAQRTAMLLNFILVAVNFVVAPRYAAFHEAGDRKGLAHMAVFSTRLATILSLPLIAIILIFPVQIMHIFKLGPGAAIVLVILGLGQLSTATCGTLGILLDMTGHERFHRSLIVGTAALSVILIIVLTPIFGVKGAAIALTIGLATQNITQALKARAELGLRFLPMCLFKIKLGHEVSR
jgi:O-antigen/teichoic acid export membrane protein